MLFVRNFPTASALLIHFCKGFNHAFMEFLFFIIIYPHQKDFPCVALQPMKHIFCL